MHRETLVGKISFGHASRSTDVDVISEIPRLCNRDRVMDCLDAIKALAFKALSVESKTKADQLLRGILKEIEKF